MSDENERSVASDGSLAWIPASDMLPKEGESVIAVVLDRSRELCWNGRYWIYPASGEREDCGVAYWMPLPAPPTDGK